jgi:hypothetical protein
MTRDINSAKLKEEDKIYVEYWEDFTGLPSTTIEVINHKLEMARLQAE